MAPVQCGGSERGYAMAALLVALSVMAIGLSMLMPAWQTMVKREREAELIFRGEQYAKAVARFQRERGAFPPSVDVLVNEKFLRKKFKDPITNEDFQVIVVGQPIPGQTTPPAIPGRGGQQPGRGGLGSNQPGTMPGGQRGVEPGVMPGTPAPQSAFQQSGFQPVTRPGALGGGGPVLGVVSKSTQTSMRLYNGRNKYNEWAFVATDATAQAGGGEGTQRPGGRGTQTPGGGRGTQTPGLRGGQGGPGGSSSFNTRGRMGGTGLQVPSRGGQN